MARNHTSSPMRRRLARISALGAVACLALAGFGSVGAQEDEVVVRPDVFRGSASSQVASVFLDRDALLPINDTFRFIALEGVATYESSNQTARASIFYPGNGVVSGPSLACGNFGGEFPEEFSAILAACMQYDYPLSVFADSLNPDSSSSGATEMGAPSDPVSARAARAVAHAAADASTTDAAIADLRVIGLPVFGPLEVPQPIPGAPELDSTVITVENALSATDQRIDETGRLVVESVAVLEGVRLIGGLVEIGSIRSTSTVSDDGGGETHRAADLEISGVTVGGVPAQVTDDGVVVGSPTGADGPLVQQLAGQLNELLDGLGVRITTLAVEDGEDDSGVAFARSGGVLVEFDIDVRGLPLLPGPQGELDPNGIYTGVIVLGQTGATGLSAYIEDPVFDPGAFSSPDLGAGVASDGEALDTTASGSDPGDIGETAAPAPEGAAQGAPGDRGRTLVSISEALSAGRVHLAYLAFTLVALAVCLGPRFALPARLPGSTP